MEKKINTARSRKLLKREAKIVRPLKEVNSLKILYFFFFLQHTTAINQISIDQSGDYVASCSDDGRVSTDHDRLFTCSIDSQKLSDLSCSFSYQ